MIHVTEIIQKAIDEHNRCNAINTFFYNNPGCEEQVALQLGLPKVDRFHWVCRLRAIERELIDYVYTNLHNKQVQLYDGTIGTIKHEPTRTFTNSKGQEEVTDNTVSFRWADGVGAKEGETMKIYSETIAVWVEIEGQPNRSHLYTINELTLVD